MLIPTSLVLFYGLIAMIGAMSGFLTLHTITKGA